MARVMPTTTLSSRITQLSATVELGTRPPLARNLDAITVRVGDLDADEPAIVLPLGLRNARLRKPFTCGAHVSFGGQTEAEVVGTRQLRCDRHSSR